MDVLFKYKDILNFFFKRLKDFIWKMEENYSALGGKEG